jgi:two-component system KDP operon response regulator KdpE
VTPIEYRLLTTLIRHAGKVVTHNHLLKEGWGPNGVGEIHYLRVYMNQLRHKLEPESHRPRYLLTEPGVCYRFADEVLRIESLRWDVSCGLATARPS